MNIHECIYKTQTLQLFTSQKNKLQHVDRSIQKVFRRGEDYINHTFWPTNWTSVPSSTDAVRCTSAHRYCISQGTENFLPRIHFQKSCVAKSEAVRLRNDITKQYNSMHFMGFEVKVCAVMVVRPNITRTDYDWGNPSSIAGIGQVMGWTIRCSIPGKCMTDMYKNSYVCDTFLSPHTPRSALGPNQPPVQCVPDHVFRIKEDGVWLWPETPSSAPKLKMGRATHLHAFCISKGKLTGWPLPLHAIIIVKIITNLIFLLCKNYNARNYIIYVICDYQAICITWRSVLIWRYHSS